MSMFIPNSAQLEILNEVGRWKVNSMTNIVESLNHKYSYRSLARYVKELELQKLIKFFKGIFRKRYLYLTPKGSALSKYPSLYDQYDSEIHHDLITSLVLQSALKFENFNSANVVYNDESNIIPDGLIFANKNGHEFRLAIEIELTAKKKTRIANRYRKYLATNEYHHVLFLFNKESTFKTYRDELSLIADKNSRKIILGLDEGISNKGLDFSSNTYWIQNKGESFEKIFN